MIHFTFKNINFTSLFINNFISRYVLAKAIKRLREDDNATNDAPPKDCNDSQSATWETGKKLFG